jgi:hypothetical protein
MKVKVWSAAAGKKKGYIKRETNIYGFQKTHCFLLSIGSLLYTIKYMLGQAYVANKKVSATTKATETGRKNHCRTFNS